MARHQKTRSCVGDNSSLDCELFFFFGRPSALPACTTGGRPSSSVQMPLVQPNCWRELPAYRHHPPSAACMLAAARKRAPGRDGIIRPSHARFFFFLQRRIKTIKSKKKSRVCKVTFFLNSCGVHSSGLPDIFSCAADICPFH